MPEQTKRKNEDITHETKATINLEQEDGMEWQEEIYDESDTEEIIQEPESEQQEPEPQVYLPGNPIDPEFALEHDESAYEMLHCLNMEWPCLSFDFLTIPTSDTFPYTCYTVAGSQADIPANNKLYVMKMSGLSKTFVDEDEESDDEDELDPILEYKSLAIDDCVNRIRVLQGIPDCHVVGVQSGAGKLEIRDLTNVVKSLDTPGMIAPKVCDPVFQNAGVEGYGIDWSRVSPGCLAAGDNLGRIGIVRYSGGAWTVDSEIFEKAHDGSVEDLQWSPSEAPVLASAGSDGCVKIWDSRQKTSAAINIKAHDCDVNVISWNRFATPLTIGVLTIWWHQGVILVYSRSGI